jgi:1,3-beta-glucanosyltransferase GAS5
VPPSLSEYGCNTNTRKFEEVSALYNTEMTSVYSGGLVYEYSEEGSKYGLVTINSDGTISEGPDFTALQTALSGTSDPSGDGGYNSTGGASGCPAQSSNWNVTSDALPAIPSAAAEMMKTGAGKGFGLTGTGSQNAGGTSTGTATPGSGSVTATSTGTAKKNSASALQSPLDKTPIFVASIVVAFSFLGATLL